MKVLYIAHYREGSGWAHSAIDYILALDSIGVDVVCRNVSVSRKFADVPERIEELEKKSLDGVTHCIQYVLPHHYIGTDKYEKNIGQFIAETDGTINSNWNEYLKLVDEVWVPNSDLANSLSKEGFTVKTVRQPADITKYAKEYPIINFGHNNHTFKFYTIADINDRKNIESTITCFHAAFDASEPVSLVIKVKKTGYSPEDLNNFIGQITDSVKKRMRLYADPESYNPQIVYSWEMSDQEIMSLHASCDCFVSTSHGEGWLIPAFDAMAMGNTPIVTRYGGPREYAAGDLGGLVSGCKMVCRCNDSPFPDLYTGRDYWIQPDEKDVIEQMHYFYNTRDKDRSFEAKQLVKNFYSYEVIGNQMKEALCQ